MSDDVTVGLESERKYDVPDPGSEPDLSSLDLDVSTTRFTLNATYFDTEEGDLVRNRVTLRRREGGHDAGWHLKTPGEGGRLEHRSALADELPESLRALVADMIQGRPLVPVARLDTDRTAITLTDSNGGAIAEVADDRVSATDLLDGTNRTWREWEAELLDAAPVEPQQRRALLDVLEAALLASGAVPSSAASKLARATGRAPLPGE